MNWELAQLVAGLVGAFILAPALSWMVGMFNPIGYLGVPPWRVPACTCGQKELCGDECERGRRMPR